MSEHEPNVENTKADGTRPPEPGEAPPIEQLVPGQPEEPEDEDTSYFIRQFH